MIANTEKTVQLKPILWGVGIVWIGFIVGVVIFQYWYPQWIASLDFSGLGPGGDSVVAKIDSEKYTSPPYLSLIAIWMGSAFGGGYVAASLSPHSRILHSIGVGVVSVCIFMNPFQMLLFGICSGLGGALMVCFKSKDSVESVQ